MKNIIYLVWIISFIFVTTASAQRIEVFAGAAGKPAIEEAAQLFQKMFNIKVDCTFSGSGTVLSQMILSKSGDVYIPGTDDFMDLAESKGVIVKGTRKLVCYLLPAICVPKGNPKQIKSLQDLAKPGIRVGIAAPKAVCLGDVAMEIFKLSGRGKEIEKNIVTHAPSCEHVATLVRLKQVDAAIGWDVFQHWAPKEIEVIPLPKEYQKWRHIPAAVVTFSKDKKTARKFVNFISSKTGKEIFRKYGYTVELEKRRK